MNIKQYKATNCNNFRPKNGIKLLDNIFLPIIIDIPS